MKKILKDKKVLLGLVVVLGAVGYYVYDQKRKANLKSMAEALASTPAEGTTAPEGATPPIVNPTKTMLSSSEAKKSEM